METKEIDSFFERKRQDIRINVNIGIDQQQRRKIVDLLSNLLAKTYILSLKTFSYHWNIRGKLLGYLHPITKEHYEDLLFAVNSIAERIRTLGWNVPDTYMQVKKMSEVESTELDSSTMISELTKNNEKIALLIRNNLDSVAEARDEATIDLLKDRLKKHEKYAWMFRSMLER